MQVYRIAKKAFIEDLSGTGSRLYGGRWNFKGISAVYTSESRALAAVEMLVHVPLSIFPKDLSIATIEIPEKYISKDLKLSELPKNWKEYPAPLELAEIGTRLLSSGNYVAIKVPSAVVLGEYNIIINPASLHFTKVKIKQVDEFFFDKRLFKEE